MKGAITMAIAFVLGTHVISPDLLMIMKYPFCDPCAQPRRPRLGLAALDAMWSHSLRGSVPAAEARGLLA